MVLGQSTENRIFTTLNNGTSNMHSVVDGLAVISCGAAAQVTVSNSVSFEVSEVPGTVTPRTYEIYWRTTSGTAYMGDNGSTQFHAPTILVIEEISA